MIISLIAKRHNNNTTTTQQQHDMTPMITTPITTTIANVLPVWVGQTGPVMPLSEVDQWPVVILSQYASAAEIAAAEIALLAIKQA